jgi:hypothetical protein
MSAFRPAALAACLLLATTPAFATGKTDFALLHAVSSVWENRIVGVWEAQVQVGDCVGGPKRQFRGLNAFQLGGTLVDTNSAPTTTRGPGVGTWRYNRQEGIYEIRMTFFRYLPDGSFDGISDVHREITLSADANSSTEVVYARVLNPDGSLRTEGCGSAAGTRIAPP